MGVKIGGQIEKINGREISYCEFAEKYLAKNLPVVLTGLMDDWRACNDWLSSNGQPDLDFFSTHFGKSKVQVADCGTREFTDQRREEMSVSEFVNHWLQDSVEDFNCNGKSVLYLKDWHFFKEYPAYLAYRTPLFFTDDWLNLYLDHYRMHDDSEAYQENNDICCSDYRFVYMGAKGSWTPLHADVFRSYSWSANVCGKKKWLFLPPLQCHLLFDRNMKTSVYNIFDDISETEFPGFKKAIWLEYIQEQNEIIFVPSGWYHQVHNLEDTISINHNWFNAHNLSWVWDLLLRDYKEAKEYIEDIKEICDDFEGICQRNLAANTGMNFIDFFIFISRFSLANVVELYLLHKKSKSESPIRDWSATVQHFALNLASIRKIALNMKSEGGVQGNLAILDLRESLSDPKFLKLCTGLGKIYAVIHKQDKWNCTMKKDLIADLENYGSQICSPEDLVKFIDYAVSEFSGNCAERNPLLSAISDMQSHNER